MKNHFSLLFLLFITTTCISQTHIVFDYDNAGNQIKRYLISVGRPSPKSATNIKDIKDIVESDLIKADIYNDIKYYPNPVREELYLKWGLAEGNKVQSMDLYNLNGQLIKTVGSLENVNDYIFPFQQLPQAIYNLVLNYSNGEKKSLKIIKH